MARRKSTHKYVPIDVRIPPEVRDAVEAAAKAKFESLSAYTRTALLARLERDGICPVLCWPWGAISVTDDSDEAVTDVMATLRWAEIEFTESQGASLAPLCARITGAIATIGWGQ